MTVDESLHYAGGFGRYQVLLVVIVVILANSAATAFWTITPVFTHPMMASAYGFSESELAGCVSLFFVGSGLGSLLGAVSDLYGRKPVLWLSLFVGTTATFSSALSWNFLSYAVCRFCAGVGTGGVLVVSHLFVLEFMVPGSRGLVGVCVSIFFAFSSAAISLVAYLLRRHSWQTLTVVLNCLPLAVLFALPWFDESPRFLLKQGHRNQAAVVLQRVARTNRKSYDCDFFGSVGEELSSGREWTLRRLLYPSLRWKILAMVFCWFRWSGVFVLERGAKQQQIFEKFLKSKQLALLAILPV
eukprot:c9993_g1_i1.p1 GENE.c9993_g1_i1~~c9993_g1_i1.p1  ORF type:complete len:331 (+),score=55.35 c9993_g1_i1:96-995(+)